MRDFWANFFSFLERHLPAWLVGFSTGFQLGATGKSKLKNENAKLRLEKELLENKEKVRADNAGKSSVDIVNDAIRAGGGKTDE